MQGPGSGIRGSGSGMKGSGSGMKGAGWRAGSGVKMGFSGEGRSVRFSPS